ncbi:hypothetical protein NQ315_012317 [Exocentrus adspersus]|uniref:Uncharacterized protein n=1 Tax=Exocentrus adspersus TaxID=1586481 RepID=A0AAV8VCN9_9CUCU|nr:hypothetical protein NQ315_012317 [Exocentrus adspersus]
MFSDWLNGGIVLGDVEKFNKIRCVALSSSLVFTSENMSTASSSSSSYQCWQWILIVKSINSLRKSQIKE